MIRTVIFATMLSASTAAAAQSVAQFQETPGAVASPLVSTTARSEKTFSFRSAVNGASYRVDIFIPRGAAPAGGWPTLFILDGDALFGTFAEAVRNRAQAGEIEAAVVVGISGAEGPSGGERTFDFSTAPLTDHEKAIISDLKPDARYGGADLFLQVLVDEVRPRVATIANVDRHRSTLFGWSLGGLFVTHAMLTRPGTFESYAALSPAIWWADRATFKDMPSLSSRVGPKGRWPRLFVGVGSLEQRTPPGVPEGLRRSVEEEVRYARMVDNAQSLVKSLSQVNRYQLRELKFRIFAGQTHNSVPWAAVNSVLDFALQRKPS